MAKQSKGGRYLTGLTIAQQHQKRIAIQTLRMTDVGVLIMGGMNKDEARRFLRSIGINPAQYE